MQYRGYSFEVEVYEIKPPVAGTYYFGGKVIDMRAPNRTRIDFFAHEHWGGTRDEAFAKAHNEAKSWIDQQVGDKVA
jgi:hypothetical protein